MQIDGHEVHVIDLNPTGADPMILVHGLYTSMAPFYFHMAPMLAKERRVILYDLRSHGMSERRDEGYTLEILTNDLLNLMEAMGLERVTLVGYSYGGSVALYAGMHHPELFSRLVIIDAPILSEPRIQQTINQTGEENLADALEDWSAGSTRPLSEGRVRRIRETVDALFYNRLLPQALINGREELVPAKLATITQPTLLAYASDSYNTPSCPILAFHIPNVTAKVFHGTHNFVINRAKGIAKTITRFLDKTA
jgi:pimeloyl-ACP methyl ester carboxylesterase